jgi:hypothetical protein
MAEPRQGFLSGYAGNGAQRTGRWLVDRLLPGNQRSPDGTLNNKAVGYGLIGRLGGMGASLYGGPMAGFGANRIAGSLVDRFSGNAPAVTGINGPQMQQIPVFNPGVNVPNIGMTPGSIPTMPNVDSQAPWQAMNPFAPGSGLGYA